MAKVIAFLLFLCIELSKQEEVASVEKYKEEFPEQAILETYPLDIKLDEDDTINQHVKSSESREISEKSKNAWKTDKAALQEEYKKISEAIEKWIAEAQPKNGNYKWLKLIESGTEANCPDHYYDKNSAAYGKYFDTEYLWKDYIRITLDIEEWMTKVDESMSRYKWLKILEEGSYENKIIPRCPTKIQTIYDYYDKEKDEFELYSSYEDYSHEDDYKLDDYTELTLDIEVWLMYAHPHWSMYKWLKVLEEGSVIKGRVPKCSQKIQSFYDYNKPGNQISFEKNPDQIMKAYNYYTREIEKWMKKTNPDMADFKWLEIIEKETKNKCLDNFKPLDSVDSDEPYSVATMEYLGANPKYAAKLSSYNKPKPQFKRFTSV